MTQPYYIRQDKAAELLDVSQRTIARYVQAGNLAEYTLPGGHKRLRHSEVLSLPTRTRRRPQ